MNHTNPFDALQEKLKQLLQESGLSHLENPLKPLLTKAIQELNLVHQTDFETQREILERLRERVKQLENRVTELESSKPPHSE